MLRAKGNVPNEPLACFKAGYDSHRLQLPTPLTVRSTGLVQFSFDDLVATVVLVKVE